jgi:hypothetical protein
MPDELTVLLTTPCEWCSTGLYQRRMAVVAVTLDSLAGATARLCMTCADAIGGDAWRTPVVPVADALPLIEPHDAAIYLATQTWTPARSVPEYPHEYVLLTRSTDPVMHLRTARWIRENGERRQWSPAAGPAAGRRVWCHYWRSGGYEHWTQPSEADPILNRKPAP